MVDTLYDVWKLGERTLWLFSWLDGEPDHFSTVFAQNYLYLSPTCYGVLSSTVHVLLAAHSPYHPIPPPPPQLKKVPLSMLSGLSRLRSQLRSLVVQRCGVTTMEEVIIRCGADDSASFSWASLREMDFSHNSINQLGDSLVYHTYIATPLLLKFSTSHVTFNQSDFVIHAHCFKLLYALKRCAF